MAPIMIYIAGFRQHAGKTAATLGLFSLLRRYFTPEELGYIKPVGQELVTLPDGNRIDKDAVIIQQFSGIPDIDLSAVSPVRLGSGFSKQYLSSEDTSRETVMLQNRITKAIEKLRHKKIIIAEGSGHPGVGGIVNLSNAEVSKILNADIIYLSGGGIGKALDMLEVDLAYFHYMKSRVRGIIFNKLIPHKIDTVKKYITEDLLRKKYRLFDWPLRIFGYLPEIDRLSKPSMKVISGSFPNCRIIGNSKSKAWEKPCNTIKVLSLTAEYLNPEKYIKPGDVILLGSASRSRRTKLLSYNRTLKKIGSVGGLVLTCGDTTPLDPDIEKEIIDSGIPAILVLEDTAKAEHFIERSFENNKIQIYDDVKIQDLENLFEEHFDLDKFLDTFCIKP